jgi:hypothetical protein
VRGRGRADPGAVIDEFDGSGEHAAGVDGAVTVDHDGAVVSRGPEGVVADCADDDVGSPWALAHPTRRYDYWLGGKENFAADRESGDAVTAACPTIRTAVVENRRFLGRAVDFLARDVGIGHSWTSAPASHSANNTHEVAQRVNPAAGVVYVDNDPIVLSHARALLTNTNQDGATAYIGADLREPAVILGDPCGCPKLGAQALSWGFAGPAGLA